MFYRNSQGLVETPPRTVWVETVQIESGSFCEITRCFGYNPFAPSFSRRVTSFSLVSNGFRHSILFLLQRRLIGLLPLGVSAVHIAGRCAAYLKFKVPAVSARKKALPMPARCMRTVRASPDRSSRFGTMTSNWRLRFPGRRVRRAAPRKSGNSAMSLPAIAARKTCRRIAPGRGRRSSSRPSRRRLQFQLRCPGRPLVRERRR